MDRLTAINVFLTVAEIGSFSATAEKLEISRPMVTRYIALIENWLNTQLFHRTTRHITLTESGKQAVIFCQKIVNLTQAMENELTIQTGELRGTLQIASSVSFGSTHLTNAINQFLAIHPKLNIHLNLSDKAINLVEDQIDLTIRICKEPDELKIARKLSPCRSSLVASPNYLIQYGIPKTPKELISHTCLAHTRINQNKWTFYLNGEQQHYKLTNRFSCDDAIALLNATISGSGIAMLPRYLTNNYVANGQLQEILTDWQLPELSLYAMYSSRHNQPIAIHKLLEFLLKQFTKQDW